MKITRFAENPLVTPADVKPSQEGLEVACAFNAGITQYQNETLMLLRVAERPPQEDNWISFPVLNPETKEIEIRRIAVSDPDLDASDPRVIHYKGKSYLTSMSHLRMARSSDGRKFTIDEQPFMMPERYNESFGVEDPRMTWIEGRCYIDYVGVSEHGVGTCLAVTDDFQQVERLGIIFCPDNRDVVLFPEKINGKYAAYHRPAPKHLGPLSMWLAYSPDLVSWGQHQHVAAPRPSEWDSGRIGGGAPPIKTGKGWLSIYHGATPDDWYCLGALLTDLEQPDKIIARSSQPLLKPEADYEMKGFYGHVVFACGTTVGGDTLNIYYGAADSIMAAAEVSISDLLGNLAG